MSASNYTDIALRSNPGNVTLNRFEGETVPDGGGAAPETFNFKIGDKEIKLPKTVDGINLQEGLGQIIGRSRSAAKQEFDKQTNDLKALLANKDITLEELQNKMQQLEDAALSADDRAKKEASREVDKLRKELDVLRGNEKNAMDLFKNTRIENDLLTEIGKFAGGVNNPSQVMMLLRTLGAADVVQDAEDKSVYKTVLKLKIEGEQQDLSPAEAVQKFLAMPENAHHLKNNLRPGGGSTAGGRKLPSGATGYTRDQLRDPNVKKEAYAKIQAGEPVEFLD